MEIDITFMRYGKDEGKDLHVRKQLYEWNLMQFRIWYDTVDNCNFLSKTNPYRPIPPP